METGQSQKVDSEQERQEWVRYAVVSTLLAIVAFVIAWQFVQPAPPTEVLIATGPETGHYQKVALEYAEVFRANGVHLNTRTTAGSVENRELLLDESAEVGVAIVQGGVVTAKDAEGKLQAVANIYLEPAWLFHRLTEKEVTLNDLAGKRVALGKAGSGTRALAQLLLDASGIKVDGDQPATFVDSGGAHAAESLKSGTIDAAFFVTSPSNPIIADLLATDGIRLMSFDRSLAYTRRYPFLKTVTLPRGVVDLKRDLPNEDTQLIAAVATIVVRQDTHAAVTQLLARAALNAHRRGSLLSEPGAFPTLDYTDLPIDDDALYHLTHGPGVMERALPFWLSSLINRLLIMVVPFLFILIPLIRLAPPVYRWRIRRRIYRWYARLRAIDSRLRAKQSVEALDTNRNLMAELEKEVGDLRVPLSYMDQFYNLRLHMSQVRGRLESAQTESGNDDAGN